MREIVFYLAGAVAVLSSFLMLFQRNLYAGAVCLLMALLQTAVMFYVVGSPLVGLMQVIICAGGVMILVVVTIVSSSQPVKQAWSKFVLPRPAAWVILALLAAELFLFISRSGLSGGGILWGSLDRRIGAVLFGPYAVATEAVALLLFLAALAATDWKKGTPS